MSFEHRLKEIQQRSVREKRIVALVLATAVFIPLMIALSYVGAFSLRGGDGKSMSEAMGLLKNKTAPTITDLKTNLNNVDSSKEQLMAEFEKLVGSSTKALENSTSTASTTLEGETASTTANATTTEDKKINDATTTKSL